VLATGQFQSPIVTYQEQRQPDTNSPPSFDYPPSTRATVENTESALKIRPVTTRFTVQYGGEVATLDELHFHVGAEHKPDVWNDPATGIAVAELHLVHKTSAGRQIVVAVPIRVGASNAFLQTLLTMKPFPRCQVTALAQALPVGALLPANRGGYMTYTGSLTTPPCDPDVTWILMKYGITATQAEINDLKIVCNNARPVQVNKGVVKFHDAD
jgi:carbonic anhydrase